MIVDTHVHVVSGDRKTYPVLPEAPDWPVTEIEPLAQSMDEVGVERALLVQTFFTYGTDNRYMIDAAAQYRRRFATVAVIDQLAPDAPQVLTTLVDVHGVRGVRFMPKGLPPGALWDPRSFPVWERAGALGIPITIAAELEHLPRMPAVVERFPQVKVAFEHMWALEIGDPPYAPISAILPLARFPNVYLKLCPNNSHMLREGKGSAKHFFGALIEHFGIERMMWGSNYPAHAHKYGNYRSRLAIMQEDFAIFSDRERRWFFSETALSLWPGLR
jgi:predicted TIM-barrel fold metal-dependent hydrolase